MEGFCELTAEDWGKMLGAAREAVRRPLAIFRDPFYDNLYEALMEQFARDPYLFHIPGDETGAVGSGQQWMRAMEELTNAAQHGGGGTGAP
ncbi:hypothetical protein [Streptomyces sp. YKOK-J1]